MSASFRFALLAIIASTIAAAAAYHFRNTGTPPQPPPEITPTTDAAVRLLALALPDLDGKTQSLAQWKSRVLVVNYWATWCAPCKEEMPEFSRLSDKYAGKSVQFVGISIDTPEKIRVFLNDHPVSYPLLVGTLDSLDLASDLGNRIKALPFTVVLRGDGRIEKTKLGKFDSADLENAIEIASRAD